MDESFTLADLAEKSGIEARTIRSYIERGLLPNADSRGRGAMYTQDHLTRLQLIKNIRKARPNVQLSEIRLLFQQSSPDLIRSLAGGTFTAAAAAVTRAVEGDDIDDVATGSTEAADPDQTSHEAEPTSAAPLPAPLPAAQLTAVERLAVALRQLTRQQLTAGGSKVEAWHRIEVTADVELSVRGFATDQLVAFREVADLLRHLLSRTDLPTQEGEE